ncbi:hypothetical protein [Rhodopila sp.]|nr:hypothetical protein [Rhodopila sp.]HVZ10215.1 hypothetical protein [Rhodopila sp.]
MKTFVLAALAAVTLGIGVANAASWRNPPPQSANQYNWMAGGGG